MQFCDINSYRINGDNSLEICIFEFIIQERPLSKFHLNCLSVSCFNSVSEKDLKKANSNRKAIVHFISFYNCKQKNLKDCDKLKLLF